MQKRNEKIEIGRTNTLVLSLLAVGVGITGGLSGCNNDDDGGPGPVPAPIFTATPGPIATVRPGATATARPGTTAVPGATATARPGTTAAPTATTVPVARSMVFLFNAQGDLSASTGQFTQTDGSFQRFNVVRETPDPVGTPGTVPTIGPIPTTPPIQGVAYTGTYQLSNGETGIFSLFSATISGFSISAASGVPELPDGFTLSDTPTQQGTATVSARVSGSTGSGSVRLSNGITGTITINRRTTLGNSAFKSLPAAVKARLLRR